MELGPEPARLDGLRTDRPRLGSGLGPKRALRNASAAEEPHRGGLSLSRRPSQRTPPHQRPPAGRARAQTPMSICCVWPSRTATSCGCRPALSINVACVWLRSCHRIAGTSTRRSADCHADRSPLAGYQVGPTRPTARPRPAAPRDGADASGAERRRCPRRRRRSAYHGGSWYRRSRPSHRRPGGGGARPAPSPPRGRRRPTGGQAVRLAASR
jgi:hypothetical protein